MGQKLIDNIETNDMNFKHLETTKDIVISPRNEFGDPQRPDATHTWTAKVSDGTNHVGDYAVKINGVDLIVDSSDFTKLPVGNYQLEVWEQWNDADGTSELSIYPSPQKTIPFTIYANVADQDEEEIKRIGFQDVVDQAVMNIGMNYVFKVNTIEPDQNATVVQSAADGKNYVTFNIPEGQQGPKGDPGDPGVPGTPGIQGLPGKDGYTPVRGVDYWTDTDQKAIQAEGQKYIENMLSKMGLEPETFENEAALKSKYPNGAVGLMLTVDTGHKWIWINGAWKDCGIYQAVGLDKQALDPIKRIIAEYGNRVSNHEVRLGIHDFGLNNHEQRLGDDDIRIKDNQTRVENIEGVGSLKDIELTDQDGNYLTDGSGVRIGGKRWLINTDKTLSQTDLPADAKAVGEALVTKPDNYDIPILYLYGEGIEGMQSKKDSLSEGLSFSFPRFNVSGTLTGIKVQGASSASLAKKNYTLHLDHMIELIPGYGKQKKYVIKADMTDFSHVRNVGCAKLWGEVRKTRIKADDAIKVNDTDYLTDNAGNHITGEADPQLSIGGNYGAVDGFPIALYINDKYWGLYTFNVPKDAWMAKMTNKWSHAIVSATWTALDKTVRLDGTDMDIEFCGTKDTTWVFRSINALIDTLKANYTSAADFDNAVNGSLDIKGAIDYYVYSAAIGNTDGVLRNYLLQTWDSKKWYIAAYDLDMTFGRTPDLPDWVSPVYNGDNNRRGGTTLTNLAEGNRLFHQLWKFHKEDIITRYKELVAGPLSSGAVSTLLTNFAAPIPDALLSQEDKTWPQTRLSGTNNLSQIRWWYMEHINFLTNSIANA